MLVINFKGNTPQQRYYSFGVKENNKSNIIRFVVDASQSDLNLQGYVCNLKVQNKEHDFSDLILLNGVYSEKHHTLSFDWLMERKDTKYRNLEMQLEFIGTTNEEIVWQTLIVELELNDTIKVGDEQPTSEELSAIKQMEQKVVGFENDLAETNEKVNELENDVSKLNNIVGSLKSNSLVELSSDRGETYIEPISLEKFIDNCEKNVYQNDVGLIARISNLINGQTMRIILIGTNHDVLSNTDLGECEPNGEKAKTTWHFYDMPIRSCQLGLPFEEERTGNVRSSQPSDTPIEECVEITISSDAPSNMHGYQTAGGLRQAEQDIYNSLPSVLQQHIKSVRKDIFISEMSNNGWNYENFDSTGTVIAYENDRYGCYVMTKLFSLSASEVGIIPNPQETFNAFPYKIPNSDGDDVMLEGTKYEYFNETYPYTSEPEQDRRRPRYYNNELWYYWLRSPCLLSSDYWGGCSGSGYVGGDSTVSYGGVAPAFCI